MTGETAKTQAGARGLRQAKQAALQLLADESLSLEAQLERMAAWPAQESVNALFPALCRTEPRIRWRGISCLGASVARLADMDMEAARVVMRRLLWSLNDESGGIGWGAPEALAESMSRHGGLAREYAHMLLSYLREDGPESWQDGNFLEHPLLQRGALWGVARLAACRPESLLEHGAGPELLPFLRSGDPELRALACLALGHLQVPVEGADYEAVQGLLADESPVTLYSADGDFAVSTVSGCAGKYMMEYISMTA